MRHPGFTVRPLPQMSGDAEFSELVLDGVEVPDEAVLGRAHDGWRVAITTLMFERGPRTLTRQLILRQGLDDLLDAARRAPAGGRGSRDPVVRQRLAQLYVDAEALRFTTLRLLTRMIRGESVGPEGSMVKLFFSETWQKVAELGLELEGAFAGLEGMWQYRVLRSRGNTIQGGTSEIMRNILAERVLGLAKDPRPSQPARRDAAPTATSA
jgi:alkylation response protein AidB-like acyl-CoA dehydrogenase